MADISPTASMRTNLLSLQNTQSLMDTDAGTPLDRRRLTLAIDNAASYYTAQSLNNRANDLRRVAGQYGIRAFRQFRQPTKVSKRLRDFVEQAKAIANSARDVASKTDIKRPAGKVS
ncbi:MAG: hypothetical protein ACLU99_03335 [Alphaproteobacteria bacterium]